MTGTVVGYAGMTHLGINSIAACAAKGFAAIGYDADASLIERMRSGNLPVSEPGLDDLVAANAARLRFTADPAALGQCDIVYLSTDVPTDDAARSDLAPIRAVIDQVLRHLRHDAIFVILCQVPPGFTRAVKLPPARLMYQVETLIFGRAVERALEPERFIVGCDDPQAPLPAHYARLLAAFDCPILRMRYESAELAKIAINLCLVASVSVANTLAEVSEAIGADWAEVVPALRLDQRIGPHSYLAPGLGIAGGNLERDLQTIHDVAQARALDSSVVDAFLGHSRYRKDWCWRRIAPILAKTPDTRIAMLGLAYKENTHSTKNAASLALLAHLKGREVRVHDPLVPGSTIAGVVACDNPLACAKDADLLVLITPWPQYRALDVAELARAMRGRVMLDPYRLVDGAKAAAAGFEYHALGQPVIGPG